MPICPILKWYTYKDDTGRERAFPINSVIEGTLTIGENERARIDTAGLEKYETFFECAVNGHVKEMFEKAGVDHDYGLIILRPEKKFSQSEVVDFISFHRHPTAYLDRPTASRFGISAYNEAFEKEVLKEASIPDSDGYPRLP